MSPVPTRVSLKKENLRSLGYESLKKWVYTKNNVYIAKNKEKYVQGSERPSKWENTFAEWEYGKKESLHLYEETVRNDTHLMNSLKFLSGKKLGCWCTEEEPCHADILIKLFKECLIDAEDVTKKRVSTSIEEKEEKYSVKRQKKLKQTE